MLVGNGAKGKEIEVPYYLLPLKNVNTYKPDFSSLSSNFESKLCTFETMDTFFKSSSFKMRNVKTQTGNGIVYLVRFTRQATFIETL